MRRAEKEIKDQTDIDNIIKEARVCRLAMADKDQPYVVPLNFGYDYPYLYFHDARNVFSITFKDVWKPM